MTEQNTLRLYGPGALDQLDPVCSHVGPIDRITRLFARQLFTYHAQHDLRNWQAVVPTPDLATEIPSIYNAGMGASYTSYVVHLRPDVHWDSTPARPVTTHDVVRGFKRLGNPLHRSTLLTYFTDTIRGMAEFCRGYAAAFTTAEPTARALSEYQNSHDIPGLLVLDDRTLVFELRRPALDFIDMLALSCASPAPVEYDDFLPGSLELCRNIRSTGPYRPVAFEPGRELRLGRNPVWRRETDPVRVQYLDAVEVVAEPVTAGVVADRIRTGSADLAWGVRIDDPATPLDHDLGFALDPYLVFNMRGADALREVAVRQAISYAIDKSAIARAVTGDGSAIRIAGSAIPPRNDGHQDLDPYATQGNRGDPARCAAMLTTAGYPDGLTLTEIHPATERARAIARCYTASLAAAAITVRSVELPESAHLELLKDPARSTDWDIALASWTPTWPQHNGRVFVQPLFGSGASANYGGYHNPEVDALIEQALAAEQYESAAAAWRKAERVALADAPIVPILFGVPSTRELAAHRISYAAVLPTLGHTIDLATLWLAPY
ncbi:ABC transporter substrate-binding protein [Nocardia arthritidis]|uniref:ABC transporter substrate-binding protein n=1 Tax=Nocardia arthritidis TaxID=228602 RepID=A0A6G9YGZ3_9NOCA|nr:ABC transporter substrate-binding protein [Nocardia arthritidis]QIS12454.1 ABC transporter substrate-binding protein [Nocardia arthritidis]